ncbi:MAG: hypothetical protein GY719_06345, partial [bacterium]|nr:hypothetical protein [bacterium]
DTPTLRLEQTSASGWTPQAWDLAGNETNFFIRDVTGGSKLPFRIKPGSPDDSIFINDDGNIGLGTDSPSEDLHVKDTSGNARMILETTDSAGHAQVYMNTGGSADWRVSNLATNGSLLFARDSGSGYTSDSVVMRAATSAVAFNTTKTMSVAGAVEASAYDILSSRTYKNELARMNGR